MDRKIDNLLFNTWFCLHMEVSLHEHVKVSHRNEENNNWTETMLLTVQYTNMKFIFFLVLYSAFLIFISIEKCETCSLREALTIYLLAMFFMFVQLNGILCLLSTDPVATKSYFLKETISHFCYHNAKIKETVGLIIVRIM